MKHKPSKHKAEEAPRFFFLRKPFWFLAGIVAIVYFRSLQCDLTHLDDNIFVLDNEGFYSKWSNMFEAFRRGVFDSGVYYRPILMINLIIEHHLWGIKPAGYHFTNLLFHIIATILFYKTLIKLHIDQFPAFIIAALFAVHPVLTHSVAWIPGRNDILLTILLLSCFLLFVKWYNTGSSRFLISFSLVYMLAVFTKETALLFPVFIAAYLFIFAKPKPTLLKIGIALIGFVVGIVFYLSLRSQIPDGTGTLPDNMLSMALERWPILIQYIGKMLIPANLSIMPLMEDTSLIYGIISILTIVSLLAYTKAYRDHLVWFGFIWCFLFLLPLLLVLPSYTGKASSFENAAYEHRLYLALPGFLLAMYGIVSKLNPIPEVVRTYSIPAIVVVFAVITVSRIHLFDNPVSFYTQAVKDAPHSATSRVALATRLFNDPQTHEQAVSLLKEAKEINPNERFLNYFLGMDAFNNHKMEEAKKYFREEINVTDFNEAYFSMADIFFRQNMFDSSLVYLNILSDKKSTNPQVYNNLLILYLEQQNYTAANQTVDRAESLGLALKPDMVQVARQNMNH